MDFEDSESQRLIRATTRDYLANAFPQPRLFAIEAARDEITRADLENIARLGWLTMAGSADSSLLDLASAIEEFGYAAAPSPIVAGNVAAYLLTRSSDARAVSLLADATSGSKLLTSSDYRTRGAQASLEHGLTIEAGVVRGTLQMVPFGRLCDAVVAQAVVDGEQAIVAVPLQPANAERVRLLDSRQLDTTTIEAPASDAAVLATGTAASALAEQAQALSTALYLIEISGMMRRLTEITAEYITNRVQFGQPIAKFQKARHRSADMWMHSETVRWASYHALWRFDRDPNDVNEIWLAKHAAVRAADLLFHNAHILHGGVGVGIEHPLHFYSQGVLELAVRGGTIPEMIERTNGGMAVAP